MVIPSISTVTAILVLYGLLFAVVRRLWTAIGLLTYLLCFVLLMSLVKQAYLGIAMSLADVHFFLLRPVENFYLFVHYPLLGLSLLGVCLGFALCLVVGWKLEQPLQLLTHARHGRWIRVTTATASLLLGMGAMLISSRPSQALANDGDALAAFHVMYGTMHGESPTMGVIDRLNLFFDNRSVDAILPPRRNQSRFAAPPEPAIDPAGVRPDILLILEESTFDATLIRNCVPKDCDQAMLHPLAVAQRTQQGPLLVHSTRGGTWLSEFALLSGFDWRVFGRDGAYAPVSLAPRLQNSLPRQLGALGYRTIAVLSTEGNFLSAQSAYEHYGFDEFYAAADLHLPSDWLKTYDHLIFDRALQLAQRDNDPRPVFLFVLTIRNHGPHGEGKPPNPAALNQTAKIHGVWLADYLGRMRESSIDFVRLADQWLKSPRPRVIGWFGDHQPEAGWDFTSRPELLVRERLATNVTEDQFPYLTQYQLSANFGDRNQQVSRDALDIAYLGTELLAFAGLPLDANASATREVAATCKGVMLSCGDQALIGDYLSYRIYQLDEVH